MPRPCANDHAELRAREGEPFDHARDCWLCWQYLNDPRYRALWDKTRAPEKRPPDKDRLAKDIAGGLGIDHTLIGNRLKDLTTAIGIPPCGRCKAWAEWLNRAHVWVRAELNLLTGHSEMQAAPQVDDSSRQEQSHRG